MLSFNCRCGHLVEVDAPSLDAGYLVWDSDVDRSINERTECIRSFLHSVKSGARERWLADFYGRNAPESRLLQKDDADVIEDILSRQDEWTRQVFRCRSCGRLYIQNQPTANEFRSYNEEKA